MPANDSVVDELEWVKVTAGPAVYTSEELPKRRNKLLENPFIPIGLLGTSAFLFFGLRAMVKSQNMNSQVMMRGRIVAQGFTIGVMVLGFMVEFNRDAKTQKKRIRKARE